MAYRNENGFIRPANTTAAITTTSGATGGDTDRSVNLIFRGNFSLFFLRFWINVLFKS